MENTPRPVSQRKRSYSTTAYSSQEEDPATHSLAPQPTCLLATAVGNQVLTYEFINNGSHSVLPSTPQTPQQQQQPPIAQPGQYEGIQMSNERIGARASSLKWSPDNSMLAVETQDGRIFVHDHRGRSQESIHANPAQETSRAGHNRCVISWSPRPQRLYFATGHQVVAWDAATKQKTECFETSSRINAVAINADDVLLAVGQESGTLDVLNRTSGTIARLDTPTGLVMSRLEYSIFNKSILGGAGNDGILRLWDTGSTGSTSIFHSFITTHEVPISGMAFSPYNRYLICTAGLDKRYALYDVEKKNVVKNTVTDYPLTSVAFKNDGISMVFGTDQGKVLLYDLRSTSRPISIVDTRVKAPITSIHFQGKQSSTLKRHQTINGHALKRQNSTGSKTATFSIMDPVASAPPVSTDAIQPPVKLAGARPAPIKTGTLSHPSLQQLNNLKSTREVQSAGANGKGILDLFAPKRSADPTQERKPIGSNARRPTAPPTLSTTASTSPATNTNDIPSTSVSATSLSAAGTGPIPATPTRGPPQRASTQQSSQPNSRTVSPFAFQIMQAHSPSGESSSSSSSVNTPPGSPGAIPPPSTLSSTLQGHGQSHLKHHHYQHTSTDSPSSSSRAKRRKSFGTLMASGGVSSPRAPSDPLTDEKIEILRGQIVDRVRNVLLDQNDPPASSSLAGASAGTGNSRKPDSQPRTRSGGPETNHKLSSTRRQPTKVQPQPLAQPDLWMNLASDRSSAVKTRPASKPSRPISTPSSSSLVLSQSALPLSPPSLAVGDSGNVLTRTLIEKVIEECLTDFRTGLRNDVQNMHLELLRQFHIQKMELEGLLKQYSARENVGLRQELEKLQEENRRLKMKY